MPFDLPLQESRCTAHLTSLTSKRWATCLHDGGTCSAVANSRSERMEGEICCVCQREPLSESLRSTSREPKSFSTAQQAYQNSQLTMQARTSRRAPETEEWSFFSESLDRCRVLFLPSPVPFFLPSNLKYADFDDVHIGVEALAAAVDLHLRNRVASLHRTLL